LFDTATDRFLDMGHHQATMERMARAIAKTPQRGTASAGEEHPGGRSGAGHPRQITSRPFGATQFSSPHENLPATTAMRSV
jgi:hypothetical protein